MSIATLARKSRAQRGASTRTGWTLATTKSGNCPGPCGGGAPAKQQSFRRLMKNKARPGVEQEARTYPSGCRCTRTQRVEGTWGTSPEIVAEAVGSVFTQGEVTGTLIAAVSVFGEGHGIFQMADCQSVFMGQEDGGNDIVGIDADGVTVTLTPEALGLPIDTFFPPCRGCCPPVATWKKTNDPKGEQSIGYYLWRKKQLTHNCIKHCIPHREHYNENPFLNTFIQLLSTNVQIQATIYDVWSQPPGGQIFTYGDTQNVKLSGTMNVGGNAPTPIGPPFHPPPDIWSAALGSGSTPANGAEFYGYIYYDTHSVAVQPGPGQPPSPAPPGWRFVLLQASGAPAAGPFPAAAVLGYASGSLVDGPPSSGWTVTGIACSNCPPNVSTSNWPSAVEISHTLHWRQVDCASSPCDNVGCKCNCNKSMGGTACCVVHKTMLPLSNSENIAWVVEERTCLQTSKPDPRNPNTC